MQTRQLAVVGAVILGAFALLMAAGAGGATHTQLNDSTESMTVTHSLSTSLTDVPADGEARTVFVTLSDHLEGSIELTDVAGAADDASVRTTGRLVDGPDNDGVVETIAIGVSASGTDTATVSLDIDAVGTYPDVRNQAVPSVRVTTGDARFAADIDNALVENVLAETRLTGPTVSNGLFGISTPEGVGIDSVSLEASSDSFPDSPMAVPLERLPDMRQNGVDVQASHNHTEMHATVENAQAGTEATMAVEPTMDADVAIDSISLTPARSGEFTLDVVRSSEPMAEFPEMNTDAKQPMGYIDIGHSIDNENISQTSILVRVAKEKVDGNDNFDKEDVALYRHGRDGWSVQDTEYRGQTPNYYVYRVTSDGFSEWATAGQQASFRITETGLNVTSDAIHVNDGVRVNVKITNEGEADGEYTTELVLNNVTVEEESVSLAAGGTTQVNFERQLTEPTTYEVRVNDVLVDEIQVQPADDSSDDTESDSGLPVVPIAAGVLALLVALAGAAYLKD